MAAYKDEFEERMAEAGYKRIVKGDAVYYVRKEDEEQRTIDNLPLLFTGFTIGVVIVAALVGLLIFLNR